MANVWEQVIYPVIQEDQSGTCIGVKAFFLLSLQRNWNCPIMVDIMVSVKHLAIVLFSFLKVYSTTNQV